MRIEDTTSTRFGSAKDPLPVEAFARSSETKAIALAQLDRDEEELAVYEAVVMETVAFSEVQPEALATR